LASDAVNTIGMIWDILVGAGGGTLGALPKWKIPSKMTNSSSNRNTEQMTRTKKKTIFISQRTIAK
jgi:hypothetical protein